MDAISQTTFSNAFSWMKMHEFRLRFHWSLLLRVQLTISQHWLRYWLGAVQATSQYLNQWWLVYRRIYASLGLNEWKLLSTPFEQEFIISWHLQQRILRWQRCWVLKRLFKESKCVHLTIIFYIVRMYFSNDILRSGCDDERQQNIRIS